MLRVVATFLLFLCACASHSSQPQQLPRSPDAKIASSGPNATDFYWEVVDPNPRSTTASFNDYYPDGSYHVSKLEFWRDFPTFVADAGQKFRALIILGPVGPLWSYYVFAFFDADSDQVTINEVVFPHARLTYKATGVVSEEDTRELLAELLKLEFVEPVSSPDDLADLLAELDAEADAEMSLGDFLFELLIIDGHSQAGAHIGGMFRRSDSRNDWETLAEKMNALANQLEATYKHGDPVPK